MGPAWTLAPAQLKPAESSVWHEASNAKKELKVFLFFSLSFQQPHLPTSGNKNSSEFSGFTEVKRTPEQTVRHSGSSVSN